MCELGGFGGYKAVEWRQHWWNKKARHREIEEREIRFFYLWSVGQQAAEEEIGDLSWRRPGRGKQGNRMTRKGNEGGSRTWRGGSKRDMERVQKRDRKTRKVDGKGDRKTGKGNSKGDRRMITKKWPRKTENGNRKTGKKDRKRERGNRKTGRKRKTEDWRGDT